VTADAKERGRPSASCDRRGAGACGTYSEIPDFSTGVADFDHPKISVNARLFDAFDLDQVEVVVLDGKNLW
jgi:hypothetical protein